LLVIGLENSTSFSAFGIPQVKMVFQAFINVKFFAIESTYFTGTVDYDWTLVSRFLTSFDHSLLHDDLFLRWVCIIQICTKVKGFFLCAKIGELLLAKIV
jgi:hypothetical protein